MQLINSNEVPLFFNIISKHINVLVPFCPISLTTIHKQLVSLPHYCGNSDLRSVNQFSKISSSTCAVFTPILDVLCQPVRSSCTSSLPLLTSLHQFLTCCTLMMPAPQKPLSTGSEFRWGKHILYSKTEAHYKLLCKTSLVHIICCMLLLLQLLPPTKN
jgi:hypothetical protein